MSQAIRIEVTLAKSWKQKIIGLIGKKNPFPLLIKTKFGIHTFGMKVPIDVVVLDYHTVVVGLKENLMPNRIYVWNPKFSTILELPSGTIAKRGIQKKKKILCAFLPG